NWSRFNWLLHKLADAVKLANSVKFNFDTSLFREFINRIWRMRNEEIKREAANNQDVLDILRFMSENAVESAGNAKHIGIFDSGGVLSKDDAKSVYEEITRKIERDKEERAKRIQQENEEI